MRSVNPTRPIRHFDTELFELSLQTPASLSGLIADSAIGLSEPLKADTVPLGELDDQTRSDVGEAVRDVDDPVLAVAGSNALGERRAIDLPTVRDVRGHNDEQVLAVRLRHTPPPII